jgi:hypothetical protein
MEHARKYMLVAPEAARLTHQPDDLGGHISGLDRDMADILKAHLDPYIKWQEYKQALQRYLHYQGALRKPFHLEFPMLESDTPTIKQEIKQSPVDHEIERIVDSLPLTRRRKALELIGKLQAAGVSFNEAGSLVDRGTVVEGTKFEDLINDSARKRREFYAFGRRKFASIIKELDIPADLVGNPDFTDGSLISAPETPKRKKNEWTKYQ